jgi:hypothetical protein
MRAISAACLLSVALVAGAQAPVPPTRSLGPVVATSQPLPVSRNLRVLSDGRVLVNVSESRQILLFDSLLKTSKPVLDSAGPPDRRYQNGWLIPYIDDTTLFYATQAAAVLLLDPNGSIARVAAPPGGGGRAGGGVIGTKPDGRGRLVDVPSGRAVNAMPSRSPEPGTQMRILTQVATGFDLVRRTLDTLFVVHANTTAVAPLTPEPPATLPLREARLFLIHDEPIVMSDGTIAIVRGRDYRVDWIDASGALTQSPRIAHEWKRQTDGDKKRLADSLTVLRDSANNAMLAAPPPTGDPAYDAAGWIRGFVSPAPLRGRAALAGTQRTTPFPPPPAEALRPIPPELIPDFLPATSGGLLADEDNRLWIPRGPTFLPPFTRIYDIVDRTGKLIDRVSVDASQTIAGFGRGGSVYVFVRDGGEWRLQRRRFK